LQQVLHHRGIVSWGAVLEVLCPGCEDGAEHRSTRHAVNTWRLGHDQRSSRTVNNMMCHSQPHATNEGHDTGYSVWSQLGKTVGPLASGQQYSSLQLVKQPSRSLSTP
jgi:hypothetical protein